MRIYIDIYRYLQVIEYTASNEDKFHQSREIQLRFFVNFLTSELLEQSQRRDFLVAFINLSTIKPSTFNEENQFETKFPLAIGQ